MSRYLAVDLGAESGRVIAGTLEDGRLTLEELHRFLNQPVQLPDGLYWDSFRLIYEIREGLRKAGREHGIEAQGIGIDTWGVDYGLLDAGGRLIENPRHYRDARNHGMLDLAFQKVPRAEIFRQTGIQFMEINTLFQLYAVRLSNAPCLDAAEQLLFMPDLLAYWLTGVKKNELTIASTSQFYNPAERRWATELFDGLSLPKKILGDIVQPGERLGSLLDEVARTTGLGEVPVYAAGGHDTASAVAAVPAIDEGSWCYISSGTWSLMGVERDQPLINDRSAALNFTNEVGVAGKIRLLKNIAGLWIVQECRRAWALEGNDYSYAELTEQAAVADPFVAVLDPDAFLDPGRMPERILAYCHLTSQRLPKAPGEMIRSVLESLALRYRQVLESLEELVGHRIDRIHIVGGGSKNLLLNRFVADATNRTVIAGPSEATAAGNILVQAMGAGEIKDLAEIRQVVSDSFELAVYEPSSREGWDEAYERFRRAGA